MHALRQAGKLVRPGGDVITIHDLPIPQLIGASSGGAFYLAGWITDKQDFDNEQAATEALAQVVSDGLFTLVDEQEFPFHLYAEDVQELRAYLAEFWEAAVLTEGTARQIDRLARRLDKPTKVVIRLLTRMTKLRTAA